jgi:hypothetical protein
LSRRLTIVGSTGDPTTTAVDSAARSSTGVRPAPRSVRLLAGLLIAMLWVTLDWGAGYTAYRFGDYREFHGSIANRVGDDPSGARRPDPRYHHGLEPSRTATDRWGKQPYPLVTNSLGFKDATPRSVPLQNASRRLIFIGDSFTEGIGIAHDDTWVGRVAQALAPAGVEVLNAGVVSYSAKIVYYKIKALLADGFRFDHLVYFIDVSDVADELLLNDFIPADRDPDDRWSGRYVKAHYEPPLSQYSLTRRTVQKLLGKDLWRQAVLTDRATGQSFLFGNEREAWTRGAQPPWLDAATASAIFYAAKLVQLCAAHGITFEVAIYPWPQEIRAHDTHSRYRELWRSFAAEHAIGCYDLHDRFMPTDAAARRQIVAECFLAGDEHWNPAGHRLVADEWLRQYRARHPRAGIQAPASDREDG